MGCSCCCNPGLRREQGVQGARDRNASAAWALAALAQLVFRSSCAAPRGWPLSLLTRRLAAMRRSGQAGRNAREGLKPGGWKRGLRGSIHESPARRDTPAPSWRGRFRRHSGIGFSAIVAARLSLTNEEHSGDAARAKLREGRESAALSSAATPPPVRRLRLPPAARG